MKIVIPMKVLACAFILPFAVLGGVVFVLMLYISPEPYFDYPDAKHAPR